MRFLVSAFSCMSILSMAFSSASASDARLSGTVLDVHGKPLAGVSVSLARAGLSTFTDSLGFWRFSGVATGLRPRVHAESPERLLVDARNPKISFLGRDVAGRGRGRTSPVARQQPAARSALATFDTLLYASGGKVRLRDTTSFPGDTGIVRVLDTTINPQIIHGYLRDDRDGRVYRTIRIGTQVWMAENLAYTTSGSFCYGDSAGGCAIFGRLYHWDSLGVSDSFRLGVCPDGWSVPTDSQWQALERAIGLDSAITATVGWRGDDGYALKAASPLWVNDSGTDIHGFHALPGGYEGYGSYGGIGADGYFWTASGDPYVATYRLLSHSSDKIARNTFSHPNGLSARCLQDSSPSR